MSEIKLPEDESEVRRRIGSIDKEQIRLQKDIDKLEEAKHQLREKLREILSSKPNPFDDGEEPEELPF